METSSHGEVAVAEIRVERKERSMLPWILGVVALALVAFALFKVLGSRDGAAAAAGDPAVQVDTAR
ncbi:MAG TPA: hypothetical protein VFH27_14620 [Longimicrobiaceae bacterium]|nr:hypothetical protein [Longimicrobiaceae bacterium]